MRGGGRGGASRSVLIFMDQRLPCREVFRQAGGDCEEEAESPLFTFNHKRGNRQGRAHIGRRQVLSGLFEAHTAQKNPEIRQVFPDFSVLSGQKNSRSKLLCTQKEIFLCRARRKAQEYWICIPSILNEARREKILFALPYPCVNAPKRFLLFCPFFGAARRRASLAKSGAC